MSSSMVWILFCFKGWQTGQSIRVQFFQWQIICLDEEQWGTGHDFPDWHDVIWVSTSFIVWQWGKGHWKEKIFYIFYLHLQLKLIFVIVASCTLCDFTISIFNDYLSKIYSPLEQLHHYALHPYPFVNIDEHVIKGQAVALWACAFQDPELLVVS